MAAALAGIAGRNISPIRIGGVELYRLSDETVPCIQQQNHQVFLLQVLRVIHEQVGGVVRRLDPWRGIIIGLAEPPAERQGGPQTRTCGRPDAQHALKLIRGSPD